MNRREALKVMALGLTAPAAMDPQATPDAAGTHPTSVSKGA